MSSLDVDDLRVRREPLHGHLADVRAADVVLRSRDEEGGLLDLLVLLGDHYHNGRGGSVRWARNVLEIGFRWC